jgi:hypothetical protein
MSYANTFELTEEIVKYCNHNKIEIRKRVFNKGVVQYVKQCLYCGDMKSIAIKKDVAIKENFGKEPDFFDEELYLKFKEIDKKIYNDKLSDVSKKKVFEKNAEIELEKEIFFKEYNEYLLSERWAKKREKVIARCKGVCEGCMENPVEHVHHLTYTHVFNEMLFELVGVCRECHNKIHPHMNEKN